MRLEISSTVDRVARGDAVSLLGRFDVEARGTGGAVEDLAIEILESKVEHLDVLLVGAPPRDYVVEFQRERAFRKTRLKLRGLALAPGTSERLVETAGLAGSLVAVDDTLRGGLIVELLGFVPDLSRPLGVAGVDGPVEVPRKVLQVGAHGLVLLVLLEVLFITLGRCGHPVAPFVSDLA